MATQIGIGVNWLQKEAEYHAGPEGGVHQVMLWRGLCGCGDQEENTKSGIDSLTSEGGEDAQGHLHGLLGECQPPIRSISTVPTRSRAMQYVKHDFFIKFLQMLDH